MTDRPAPPADRATRHPTQEQLASVAALPPDRPVVMLNLLRFRDVADYAESPDLAPDDPVSGQDAYARYGAAAMPHLSDAGAEIVYHGSASETIIGPTGEHWDQVVLVRYPSPAAFLGMVTTSEYQQLSGHRTAALADSRLVPTLQS
jgi:uncharacterized protein (DUF1330 family)